MCQFLSAIVLKNGDVLHNPYTDSHEELVDLFNLRDNREGNFARVEFTPKDQADLDKPEKYALRVDEGRTPDWLTEAKQNKAAEYLRSVVNRMIINQPVKGLAGGAYILTQGANVQWARAVRIVVMRGNSQVGELRGNSKVGELWGNSQVGELRENSQVGVLRENSQVGVLWENSQVGELWGNSKVGELWGNSQVGVLWGNSQVGVLRENSQVGELWENSKVVSDKRTK